MSILNAFERMSYKLAYITLVVMVPYAVGTRADNSGTLIYSINDYGLRQVTANLTPKLTAVVQIITEQNYDNTYGPQAERADIKYQFTPDFSVSIGRTVLPVFLPSDSREAVYINPWLRPLLEYGPLTARIAHHKLFNTGEVVNSLYDTFWQFEPQGAGIVDKYHFKDKLVSFIGIGASYDPGAWFVIGEWGHVNGHSDTDKRIAWSASSGYRFGRFTPYLTYTQAKMDNLTGPGLTVSALPALLAGTTTDLNAVINKLSRTKFVQQTVSIGARWDLFRNAVFKLQFDHTDRGAGSTGTLINFQPGGSFNVLSATIDFDF